MNMELMNNKELQAHLAALNTDEPPQPLGKFGRMAIDYLHETDPQRFSSLKMQGVLISTMERVDEEAQTKLLDITKKLLEQDPVPKTDDILERTRHLNEKRGIAREIVLREIVLVRR